jgi:pilus assembly protein CpaD
MSSSKAGMMRTVSRLIPVLAAALALQACATDSDGPKPQAANLLTPTEQYPIEVRQNPDEIRLAIHDRGLSDGQAGALAALVDRWRETGGGAVTIQAPRNGDGQASLYAEAATRALADLGVPLDRVRLVGYEAPAGKPAPLIVGFAGYEAVGPTCGKWGNLTANGSNKPYENFGCATSANFAAQIANPRDLLAPRDMTPADAARRQVVLDKYRRGEITSTARDEQATASSKPASN